MRTGAEVRVSTAIITASLVRKPRELFPKSWKPLLRRSPINLGSQKCRGDEISPGLYDVGGRSKLSFLRVKSAIRCAGAVCRMFPCCQQICSSFSWKRIIASGCTVPSSVFACAVRASVCASAESGKASHACSCRSGWARSSVRSSTTIPELLHFVPRLLGLIPFTTIWCGPLAAGTTNPPGHMQKLYTPRPSTCCTKLYSAAGRYFPRPALLWYWIWSMSIDGCSSLTPTAMPFGSMCTSWV